MGEVIKLESNKLNLDGLSIEELFSLQSQLIQESNDCIDLVNELMSEHTRTLKRIGHVLFQIEKLKREEVPF